MIQTKIFSHTEFSVAGQCAFLNEKTLEYDTSLVTKDTGSYHKAPPKNRGCDSDLSDLVQNMARALRSDPRAGRDAAAFHPEIRRVLAPSGSGPRRCGSGGGMERSGDARRVAGLR